ncbi:MAG: adenylate kinase family protein [Candidatus Woesearchaeota archaeon]
MIITILGPQGSGKGTQADKLAEEFDMTHVSMGDVLRDEVHKHGKLAGIIRECMNEGKLIPDEINNKIVSKVIEKYERNLILDGYPRNLDQAKYIANFSKPDILIFLTISDDVAVKRISRRLVCTGNHKVYTEGQVTPQDIKECEESGGKIVRREDDNPKNVLSRLKVYHEETVPAIEHLKNQGCKVIEIDAEADIDRVFSILKTKVHSLIK